MPFTLYKLLLFAIFMLPKCHTKWMDINFDRGYYDSFRAYHHVSCATAVANHQSIDVWALLPRSAFYGPAVGVGQLQRPRRTKHQTAWNKKAWSYMQFFPFPFLFENISMTHGGYFHSSQQLSCLGFLKSSYWEAEESLHLLPRCISLAY